MGKREKEKRERKRNKMRRRRKIALSVIIALLAMGWHARGSVIPQKDAGSGTAQTEERSKEEGFSLGDIADVISGAGQLPATEVAGLSLTGLGRMSVPEKALVD